MVFPGIAAQTPKMLDRCLDLFLAPREGANAGTSRPAATPAKYASHPDIQYFSSVKKKHHYAYHKSKHASAKAESVDFASCKETPAFDPFSRRLLLARLRSYTALNWGLPYLKPDNQLTELFCSAHGWVCEPVFMSNASKNSLLCTGCRRRLVLTFTSPEQQPAYAACFFDVDDVQELNVRLKDLYVHQVELTAHAGLCPWRAFACPLDGTYYLTPHIGATNNALISAYLSLLHTLFRKLTRSSHYEYALASLAPHYVMLDLTAFIKVSNLWLLSRYFRDSKENWGPTLAQTLPPWAYVLAAMGWDLEVQTFGERSVPLLVCTMCNQRIFLETMEAGNSTASGESDDVSSHKPQHKNAFLDPVYGMAPVFAEPGLATNAGSVEKMVCEQDEQAFACHKPWCALVHNLDGMPYFSYFHDMLIHLEVNIGPQGQYQDPADNFGQDSLKELGEVTEPAVKARKRSHDAMADLEKFVKLRKIYFGDSES